MQMTTYDASAANADGRTSQSDTQKLNLTVVRPFDSIEASMCSLRSAFEHEAWQCWRWLKAGAHLARHIFSAELWKGAPLSKQSLASSHHDCGTCSPQTTCWG